MPRSSPASAGPIRRTNGRTPQARGAHYARFGDRRLRRHRHGGYRPAGRHHLAQVARSSRGGRVNIALTFSRRPRARVVLILRIAGEDLLVEVVDETGLGVVVEHRVGEALCGYVALDRRVLIAVVAGECAASRGTSRAAVAHALPARRRARCWWVPGRGPADVPPNRAHALAGRILRLRGPGEPVGFRRRVEHREIDVDHGLRPQTRNSCRPDVLHGEHTLTQCGIDPLANDGERFSPGGVRGNHVDWRRRLPISIHSPGVDLIHGGNLEPVPKRMRRHEETLRRLGRRRSDRWSRLRQPQLPEIEPEGLPTFVKSGLVLTSRSPRRSGVSHRPDPPHRRTFTINGEWGSSPHREARA